MIDERTPVEREQARSKTIRPYTWHQNLPEDYLANALSDNGMLSKELLEIILLTSYMTSHPGGKHFLPR